MRFNITVLAVVGLVIGADAPVMAVDVGCPTEGSACAGLGTGHRLVEGTCPPGGDPGHLHAVGEEARDNAKATADEICAVQPSPSNCQCLGDFIEIQSPTFLQVPNPIRTHCAYYATVVYNGSCGKGPIH